MPKDNSTYYLNATETERLIECVKAHPFLYDGKHKDYKNIELKNLVWETIAKQVNENTTAETMRTRWKNIRDGYTKHKKMTAAGKLKTAGNYVWGTQLAFLDRYFYVQSKRSLSPPMESIDDDSYSSDTGNTTDKGKRIKLISKSNNYDGVDHLFLSYADTFKKLPQRKQVMLKLELAKLFAEVELSQYDDDSQFDPLQSQYSNVKVEMNIDNDGDE